ncbi:MAG: hypothetical protein WDN46_03860 [Methylocella sp.]
MNDLEKDVSRLADSLFAMAPVRPTRRDEIMMVFEQFIPNLTKVAFAPAPLPLELRKAFSGSMEDMARRAFIKRLNALEAKNKDAK